MEVRVSFFFIMWFDGKYLNYFVRLEKFFLKLFIFEIISGLCFIVIYNWFCLLFYVCFIVFFLRSKYFMLVCFSIVSMSLKY